MKCKVYSEVLVEIVPVYIWTAEGLDHIDRRLKLQQ